ncbi:hypothetical protein K502DRAFT_365714 [Neoconidiobolus thromboides FSU 785]|nr:hypothetical protein K502DRAFT_365714 [Neoconidiobolus thromboides FSU 785]
MKFNNLPKLIVVDLDYTIWPFWVDCHISGAPFKVNNKGLVVDRSGFVVKLYPYVASILIFLKCELKLDLAIASRTPEPVWAQGILEKMTISATEEQLKKLYVSFNLNPPSELSQNLLQPYAMLDLFESVQMYPGNKIPHFNKIKKETGYEFQEMAFFDDEPRNIKDVNGLGVSTLLVGEKGLNVNALLELLEGYK